MSPTPQNLADLEPKCKHHKLIGVCLTCLQADLDALRAAAQDVLVILEPFERRETYAAIARLRELVRGSHERI